MAAQDNNSYWNSVSTSYRNRTKNNYESEFEELSKKFDNGEITEEEFNQEIDNIQKKYGVFWEQEKQKAEEEQKKQEALNEIKRNGLNDFRNNYKNLISSYKRLSDNKDINDEDKNALIDIAYKNYVSEGHEDNDNTKQLVVDTWNKQTNDENIDWAAKVIAKNAYKAGLLTDEQYDRFWDENRSYLKLGQLAQLSKILSDKTYADEIREEVAKIVKENSAFGENENQIDLGKIRKEGFNKIIDGISKLAEKQKDKSKFERVLQGLAYTSSPLGSFLSSILTSKDAREIDTGAAEMAGASIGNVLDGVGQGIARLVGNPFYGTGNAKDVDKITGDLSNSYLSYLSYSTGKDLENEIKSGRITPEAIQADFDMMSESSPIYKQLTSGTKRNQKILDRINDNKKRKKKDDLNIEDEKIIEYAKLRTLSEEFGDDAASNYLNEYWKNNAAKYQSKWDYAANTGGQFASTFVADAASTAAIFGSAMSVFNPDDENFGNPNIVEDLVTDNSLMRYASDLQMTGAFNPKKQKQYKEDNINKYQTFKTSKQENQMVSVRDIPELIGQYGFTAATTLISMGGSAVVKGLSTSMARSALQQGLRATGREVRKKATRELLKDALESGISKQEIRSAFENAVRKASTTMYYGNLAVAGTVGTAEGALEAISTFDEFMKNKDMVDTWRNNLLDAFITEETMPYLEALMRRDGIKPKGMETVLEGENQVGKSFYTTDQYRDAAIKYIAEEPQQIQEAYETVLDRLKEDGVDAATANFWSNSLINGILNVCLKELTLSKDAQSAVRAAKGERGYSNITATRNDKGYSGFQRAKTTRENWRDYISNSVLGGTVKQSTGEFIEEYSQNISDRVARAVFEKDLINTMEKVMNSDAKEAIGRDWVDLLNTAFDELGSSLTDREAIKEGFYGFLSSAIGGFSPANLPKYISAVGKNWAENMSIPQHRSFAGFAGRLFTDLGYFYDGAIAQNYRQSKGEEHNDQRFVDYLNAWFGNDDTRRLLSGLTSATAYLSDRGIGEDNQSKFDYKDGELGVLIETATIMNELSENPLIAFYLKRLEALRDININEAEELLKNQTDERAVLYRDLINQFRNSNKDKTALTDIEVLSRIKKNAEDFFKVKRTIDAESRHIDDLFYGQNLDPIVKRTLIHALMTSKDSDERAGKIESMMADFFDNNNTFENANKKDDKENKRKHFIAEYGSIANIDLRIKEYEDRLDKTENKNEIEAYKYYIKQLQKIKKDWEEANIENTVDAEGKPVIITNNIITADEMKTLPFNVVAKMVINRDKPFYSQNQKEEIKKYLEEIYRDQLNKSNNVDSVENIIEDIEDYGILKKRRDKYVGLLNSYINNPAFLNQAAMDIRVKDKERTLKYLYRDYFSIKDGQETQDYIDSIESKINELREKDEAEARDFEAIVAKNSSMFKKYRDNIAQVAKLQQYDFNPKFSSGRIPTKEEQERMGELRAMIISLIKTLNIPIHSDAKEDTLETLLSNDTDAILKALKAKNANGEYVLNQVRKMLGFKELNESMFNDDTLRENINSMKSYIDERTNNNNGIPIRQSQGSSEEKPGEQGGGTKKPRPSSSEQTNLSIIPIAETIESGTPEEKVIVREYGASVVRDASPVPVKIKFIKVKGTDRPLAVVVTKTSVKGATEYQQDPNRKNGEHSYVLGFVDVNGSPKLREKIKKVQNGDEIKLSEGEQRKLMSYNKVGSENANANKDNSGFKSAREVINEENTSRKSFKEKVKEYIGKRSTKQATGNNKTTYYHLVDQYGHIISRRVDNSGKYIDIFHMNIYDTDSESDSSVATSDTVENILSSGELSDAQKIEKLRKNEFFDAIFSEWEIAQLPFYDDNTVKANGIYDRLIGHFLYLGDKRNNLKFSLDNDNKKLTITLSLAGKDRNIEIELPDADETKEEKERKALNFLTTLLEVFNGNDIKFTHFIPNLDTKSTNLTTLGRTRQDKILSGMIEGDLIEILPFGESNRTLSIKNPFHEVKNGGRETIKEGGSTTDNNGTGGVTTEEKADSQNETKEQKKTIKIINNIIKKYKDKIVRSDEKEGEKKKTEEPTESYYTVAGADGEESRALRVTQLEAAAIGSKASHYIGGSSGPTIATANGNLYDIIGKTIIRYLMKPNTSNKVEDIETLTSNIIKEIKKALNVDDSDNIPNISPMGLKSLNDYIGNFISFINQAKREGWTFKADDMRVTADVPVYNGNTKVGTIKVAGEIDLIAIDKDGNTYILDFKTTKIDPYDTFDSKINNNKGNWQAQTSSYTYLLQNMEDDEGNKLKVKGILVIPTFLKYNAPGKLKVSEDGIRVVDTNENNVPIITSQQLRSDLTKDGNNFKDCLVELDFLNDEEGIAGYSLDRLKELGYENSVNFTENAGSDEYSGVEFGEDQELGDSNGGEAKDTFGAEGGDIKPGNVQRANTPKGKKKSRKDYDGFGLNEDDESDKSERTKHEANTTEFINNHVKPFSRANVSFIGRVVNKTKGIFSSERKLNRAYKNDLANTFFGGNMARLESVIGEKDITFNTLEETLNKIAEYFKAYIQNAGRLEKNIETQYHASRITYDFMSGNMSINQVESELARYGLTIQDISEIAEYINTEDKEAYAASVIKKLNESKIHTKEVYEQRKGNLATTIDAMKARLDFLNSSNASSMMKDRLKSLRASLQEDAIDVVKENNVGNIKNIIKDPKGIYGARNLLKQVIKYTGNKDFKVLAQAILSEIELKDIPIAVSINDDVITDVEGETAGNTIIMQSASLESYERFERVLLHELIHVLTNNSPELKNTISELYEQSLDRLASSLGETKANIKKSYYGFKNVNEFISEFFTNYAFQEQLRSLDTVNGDNVFDKFIGGLKNMFGENLFNKINDAMNSVVPVTNIEKQNKSVKTEQERSSNKSDFDRLEKGLRKAINKLGISKDVFNNLTREEQFAVKECCM